MTRVTIFGDESGTMPVADGDGPFCTAAIATLGPPPVLNDRSGHRIDVFLACTTALCVPQVAFVRPSQGYGQQLRAKTSKMSTMARASRLVTGSHEYVPDRGYSARNLVWIRSMAIGLARVVVRMTDPQSIDSVVVALDRKGLD